MRISWFMQEINGIKIYRSELLSGLDWLEYGFSTRSGGVSIDPYDSLNMGLGIGDDPKRVKINRERFFALLGITAERVFSLRQVHSNRVLPAPDLTEAERFRREEADGLVTDAPGIGLATVHADCAPVVIADPVRRAVAVIHAGWRGALEGIVTCAVKALEEKWGAKPERLLATIGPTIGPCCYQVSKERYQLFHGASFLTESAEIPVGDYRLDLAAICRAQLRRAGLRPEGIEVAKICTSCEEKEFFSYRRDQGRTGRMLSLTVLKQPKSKKEKVVC